MRKRSPIADVVMHPVRLRIIQQLGNDRRVTTSDLRSALPDIAQATLYRHVAAPVDAGVVAVVEERRVRGAVERTFALGDRMAHVDHDELREMGDRELQQSFLTFLAHLAEDFDRAKPLSEAMGKLIVHCGPSAHGAMVKLLNNALAAINAAALAEAIDLAEHYGLESERLIQVMSAGYSFSAALLPTTAPTCPPGTGKTRV